MPDNNNLIKSLEEIKDTLKNVNEKVDWQNNRIDGLEKILKTQSVANFAMAAQTPPPPPPPPYQSEWQKYKDRFADCKADAKAFADDSSPEKPELSPHREAKDKDYANLEEKIGGKWFAKIGIAVLVLGVSFFLKYAFDENWIGETGRIVIGIITGLVLLAIGEKTIRKYFLYGQIISGGGIAVLYLSIFAALNFYHLISDLSAGLFMVLITAASILLSLRYDAYSLVLVAVIGGFATPFLISSGENNQVGLFSYVALLDMAVLAVSVFKKWRWLNLVGFLGTLVTFCAWSSNFYTSEQLFSTVFFLTIFFIIYSISSLVYNLVKKENSSGIEQVLTLFSGFIYFGTCFALLDPDYHAYLGFFAVVIAFYYLLWAYLVKKLTPADENLYNFLAFLSVGFITVAIPIQFEKYIITICWLIEALLLLYLGLKIKEEKKGLTIIIFGLFIFSLGLSRILFVDQAYYQSGDLLLLNKVFLTSLLSVIVCYISVLLFKQFGRDFKTEKITFNNNQIKSFFIVLASILTVFAVSQDIYVYHQDQIDLERKSAQEVNSQIRNTYGNVPEYYKSADQAKIDNLNERSSASISLFWLIYGVIIIYFGTYKKNKYLIVFGIILNAFVAIKLFVYDLWQFKTMHRVWISTFTILSSYVAAVLFYTYGKLAEDNFIKPKKMFIIFIAVANLLTVVWASREIFIHYDDQINSINNEKTKFCSREIYDSSLKQYTFSSDYDLASCELYNAKAEQLGNKSSITISIFWLVYAMALVAIGFVKKYKWVRMGGITLLLVAILKLFFIDLWSLGKLYRIIASISLGVVLLGISFAYQKYKNVFKEIIN